MSSMTRLTARRFAKHRMALASGVLIILLALAAGAAPLAPPHGVEIRPARWRVGRSPTSLDRSVSGGFDSAARSL